MFKLKIQKLQDGYVLEAFPSEHTPTLRRKFDDWEQVAITLKVALALEDREIRWIHSEAESSVHSVPVFEGIKLVAENAIQMLGLTTY